MRKGWERRTFLLTCLPNFIREGKSYPASCPLALLSLSLIGTNRITPLIWRKVRTASIWLFKPFCRMWAKEMEIRSDSRGARKEVSHDKVKLKRNCIDCFNLFLFRAFAYLHCWGMWFFIIDMVSVVLCPVFYCMTFYFVYSDLKIFPFL